MFETLIPGLDELPIERLEAELCQLAAHVDAGMCRWLVLLGEFDARAGHEAWECRSAAHWVSWRCGIAPVTAYEHLRVARALRGLPVMTAAFAAGRLSYAKVRALTRLATPDSEAELVDLALIATDSQLDRMIRASRKAVAPDDSEDPYSPQWAFDWYHDDDGCLVGQFRLPATEGAIV